MSELIDRQAAIEELKSYIVDPERAISENPDDVFQYNSGIRTAIGVITELRTSSPWHRVEEELPPKATWVLTVATYGNVKLFNIATVDAGGQWWTCSPQNILRELYGVRYWMPIEPPKEEEHGN